ncbi:hypothetical protein Tco_1534135, partial [Tanacetum coccineum]
NMEADNMEAMEATGPSVTEKPTNRSVHLDLDLEDDDLNQPPEPGHLAARLGCAEMKVATWDDLAFKLIILGWNVKHRILQNVDPWYGYYKNHKKMVKTGKTRTRERIKYKRDGKASEMVNKVNPGQPQEDKTLENT